MSMKKKNEDLIIRRSLRILFDVGSSFERNSCLGFTRKEKM